MSQEVTALLMVGGWGTSDVERLMRRAHQAAAQDLMAELVSTGLVTRGIVATDDADWAAGLSEWPVEVKVDPRDQPFHFGRRLAELVESHHGERVIYSGGASAPLMNAELWGAAISRLTESDHLVVTNNVHSCDWIGFTPSSRTMPRLSGQVSDNTLAWVLTEEAGLDHWSPESSAATRFDLDTPADLLMAQHHPGMGPYLRRYLDSLDLDGSRVEAILAEMARDGGSLALVGRVSPAVWSLLDEATRCWVRVFAEERGMRASGRQLRGEVRSLLDDYVSAVGFEAAFERLAGLVRGVLMDDRVLLAARGLWPSAEDRYNSDLVRWERVQDPYLRDLTRAAAECSVPVLLGGHSVVAGGLMVLVEVLEIRRRADPGPSGTGLGTQ